ncbi:hypothetical protein QTH65_05825 [Clostridium perfringens]|nr:hypothetical protein [Clostridium perfringens]
MKLTSIMGDSYVYIPGHEDNNITYDYTLEGQEFAMETLNEKFKVNVEG